MSGVHNLLLNKYYVDEIYGAIVIRPLVFFSMLLWKVFDVIIIDGMINSAAMVYDGASDLFRRIQSGRVRSYATMFVIGVVALMAAVLWIK